MPDSRETEARRAEGEPSRQAELAALCRQLVVDAYAPAAVLINLARECLYSLGPTDRYLRVAPGQPTLDVLAMARQGSQTKLRFAIDQATRTNARTWVPDCRASLNGTTIAFGIDAQPVQSEGEALLLLCFVDEPDRKDQPEVDSPHRSIQQVYQSTNEALETSKGELQSFNTVLTTLNGELQRSLERQRTTSADLQNILYSTDVATLFLDTDLNIRFFTPATKSLFSVIPGDIGRPLADLHSLAVDGALLADVQAILAEAVPIEREIEAESGAWYIRRVQPYRTLEDKIGGVVITFTDITERKQIAKALEAAKQEAEQANAAKSRFLAAASHDLRQPLQTLTLLQGLLAKSVTGDRPQELVRRVDETLSAMSGMLNALLDINKIEAGTVNADKVRFRLNDLFDRLRDEFGYPAQAKRLALRVVKCDLSIETDPHLLEQMIRNLLANALKYTKTGKVLLGCRRRRGQLSIQIWDTGVGIPGNELLAIFEEYHQLDNAARERSRGLGLGLSIVQRLGVLLDHRVTVRSTPGKGSVFSIDIALPLVPIRTPTAAVASVADAPARAAARTGAILIVEDDPEVRELLNLFLTDEGHRTATAANGIAALALIKDGMIQPDLMLSDFNLPSGMDGLEIAAALRRQLERQIPTIILTGDISTDTVREIVRQGCTHLKKR